MKDGKPTYTYNWLGLQRYSVAAPGALPAGKATITYEFVSDGGGMGKGGMGTLSVNGQKIAEGTPKSVLADAEVIRAYLGDADA